MEKHGKYEIIKYIGEKHRNPKKNKILLKCNVCGKEKEIVEYGYLKSNQHCTCLTEEYIKKEYGNIEDMEFVEVINFRTSINKTKVKLRCKVCGVEKAIPLIQVTSKKGTKHSYYCTQILLEN